MATLGPKVTHTLRANGGACTASVSAYDETRQDERRRTWASGKLRRWDNFGPLALLRPSAGLVRARVWGQVGSPCNGY